MPLRYVYRFNARVDVFSRLAIEEYNRRTVSHGVVVLVHGPRVGNSEGGRAKVSTHRRCQIRSTISFSGCFRAIGPLDLQYVGTHDLYHTYLSGKMTVDDR